MQQILAIVRRDLAPLVKRHDDAYARSHGGSAEYSGRHPGVGLLVLAGAIVAPRAAAKVMR